MNAIHHLRSLLAATVLGAAFIGTAAASVFTEVPDAGQTIGAANDASAVSPLFGITGTLSNEPSAGPDLVDMFRVSIPIGASFFANTGPGNAPSLIADPVLFLFDAFGFGVAMDDETGGFGQASLSTGSLSGGIYYLAIAFAGLDPLDNLGNPIFDTFGNGALLSALALDSWFGSPLSQDPSIEGRYSITTYYVPLPGTLLLAVIALAALRTTRKSRVRCA